MPPALLVHALKISMPQQPHAAWKFGPLARTRQTGTAIRRNGVHSSQSKLRFAAIPEQAGATRGSRALLKPACGPWRAGARSRPVRPWSSYACEIRASSSDDGGLAATCALASKNNHSAFLYSVHD